MTPQMTDSWRSFWWKLKQGKTLLTWFLSNVQVVGQNAETEQMLHNPDGIGKSSFKTEKSLKWHKNSI